MSTLDAVASVREAPCPLIFLDTAAILDVPRVAFREELPVRILESAAALIDDVSAEPRRAWMVSTNNVMQEFAANRSTVLLELNTKISSLRRSVAHLSRVANFAVPQKPVQQVNWLDDELVRRLCDVVDTLAASLTVFRGGGDCVGRARDRLWAGHPPASKSKQEFKDCEIFEEFLEFALALRRSEFDQPIVFVTPNARDYGKPPGHAKIASDLATAGASFAGNMAWAHALIRPEAQDGAK